MAVDFRAAYAKVTWDLASKRFSVDSWGKKNDTGRGLQVTILQNGIVFIPTAETISMSFKKPDGTDGKINGILENGKYYIENMSQVFAVVGQVYADLEFSNGVEFVRSMTFVIMVFDSQESSTIISSNDYTALQEALLSVTNLEENYAPQLAAVTSQLAETMNKTAVTLSRQFADNTARNTYFTANPTEKKELTFIKVGTAYQQLINGVWTSASPVLAEIVTAANQPFTPVGGISATNTQAAIAELDTEKANKLQEIWITPSLLNGWVDFGGVLSTAQYFKDQFGIVHLKGVIKSGVGAIMTFPGGYRPSGNSYFSVANDGAIAWIIVATTGSVTVNGPAFKKTLLSLDGIKFKAV